MDRRTFLKSVAAASAVAGVVTLPAIPAIAAPSEPSTVFVGKGTAYEALVESVVARLGGMQKFVKTGDKVVVKPNIGWDRNVDQAANTHPAVVKTLVKLALAAGAKQVLVFDNTCNDARRCYKNSGIQEAVESLNDPRVSCPFVERSKFVTVAIAGGSVLKEWEIYKDALECDCYINVPIAKHHGLAKLTLGLKNVMGVIGGKRGNIHQQIGDKLADLNTLIRPKLTVIDATRILLRSGPQGGKLEDVEKRDTVIASTDSVAADAYATTLFGLQPDAIASTVAGHKAGLGEMDLQKVRIVEV